MVRSFSGALVAVVLAAATALALAGCAPAVHPTAGQTKVPAFANPQPSDAATPQPSAPSTSQPTPPPTTPDPSSSRSAKHDKPAPPPCNASEITVLWVPSDNEAGKQHVNLEFLNKSATACQAYGNPFVWFSDKFGNKISLQSMSIDGTSAPIITIQPNQLATAPLVISDADFIQSCNVVQATYLVVTPAGAEDSDTISIPETDGCSNLQTMTVGVEVLT
jgi:hypothetical protein